MTPAKTSSNISWSDTKTLSKITLIAKKVTYTALILIFTVSVAVGLYYLSERFTDKWWISTPASFAWMTACLTLASYHFKQSPFESIQKIPIDKAISNRTPASFTSMAISSIILGPLFFWTKNWDFTEYHKPNVANTVSKELRDHKFSKIARSYGNRFNNLIKYGFVPQEHKRELATIYKDYKGLQKEIKRLGIPEDDVKAAENYTSPHDKLPNENAYAYLRILAVENVIEARWKALLSQFEDYLPFPAVKPKIASLLN